MVSKQTIIFSIIFIKPLTPLKATFSLLTCISPFLSQFTIAVFSLHLYLVSFSLPPKSELFLNNISQLFFFCHLLNICTTQHLTSYRFLHKCQLTCFLYLVKLPNPIHYSLIMSFTFPSSCICSLSVSPTNTMPVSREQRL